MQAYSKRNFIAWSVAAILWIGVMALLSGQPAEQSAELSGVVGSWLRKLLSWIPEEIYIHVLRKAAHCCIFTVEGFLSAMALLHRLPRRRALVSAAVFCGLLAVVNELQQLFAEGRSCEFRDMCIDTAGALVGIAAAAVILHLFSKHKNRHTTGEVK